MNQNPFNSNFDKLESLEQDNLRLRNNKDNNENSPEDDTSMHTDNNTDLRKI